MKNIILLGGAPAIGKSTVAKKLAHQLKILCISTDDIRAEMRTSENKDDLSPLFLLDKNVVGNPANFFNAISVDDLIDLIDKESIEVWRGVLNMIDNIKEGESIIIEGVAILPEKAAFLEKCNDNIKTIILTNSNIGLIRNTIYNRGVGGSPNLFSEKLKHKQMKWIDVFNRKYNQEALKYGFPVIDVDDPDHIRKIIKLIN